MTKIKGTTLDALLEQDFRPKESIFNGRYTKTALFLLKMVDLNLQHSFMQKYLYNAFLDDQEYKHDYKQPIFLLFKCKSFEEKDFRTLIKTIQELPYFKHSYSCGKQDGFYLTMIVLETPQDLKQDYLHFKASRYSQMSNYYKKLFPKEIEDSRGKAESIVWGALNKSDKLKDRVAKLLCPMKDDKVTPLDPADFAEFRKHLDTLPEIWDAIDEETEIYRYSKIIQYD